MFSHAFNTPHGCVLRKTEKHCRGKMKESINVYLLSLKRAFMDYVRQLFMDHFFKGREAFVNDDEVECKYHLSYFLHWYAVTMLSFCSLIFISHRQAPYSSWW